MNDTTLLQAIYVSRATPDFAASSIHALLTGWRANNAALNVTGILFYYRNSFLQVLEGPGTGVRKQLDIFLDDGRHADIAVLTTESVPAKLFGEWSMGYVDADAAGNLVDEYVTPGVACPLLALSASDAKRMLAFFRTVAGG